MGLRRNLRLQRLSGNGYTHRMTPDETSVAGRLRNYAQRIDELMALVDPTQYAASNRAKAQELLTALKADLEKDYKAGSTIRGDAALTDAERQWWIGTIQQAYANLRVPVNSNPMNSRWFSELYDCHSTIGMTLHDLEKR